MYESSVSLSQWHDVALSIVCTVWLSVDVFGRFACQSEVDYVFLCTVAIDVGMLQIRAELMRNMNETLMKRYGLELHITRAVDQMQQEVQSFQ